MVAIIEILYNTSSFIFFTNNLFINYMKHVIKKVNKTNILALLFYYKFIDTRKKFYFPI